MVNDGRRRDGAGDRSSAPGFRWSDRGRGRSKTLAESEAFYEDQRENDASIIVDAVRSMSQRKRDPSILAAFEKTVKYVVQTAEKAAKTRKRNAEAKKAGTPSDPSTPA